MDRGPPRRLLFFAYYFPPLGGAGSLRALSFARHLPSLGWEVTVVTPRNGVYGVDPDLPTGPFPGVDIVRTGSWEPAVLLRKVRQSAKGGGGSGGEFVEEARLGALGNAARGLLRRLLYFPDSSRGWIRPAVAAARKAHAERPFDAVLSSSPPVSAHLAALRFRRATGIPWLADWRDAWTGRMDGPESVLAQARALEKELLTGAGGLSAATEGLLRWVVERRGGPGVARAVRNGWEPADFDGAAPESGPGDAVLYAGTVYGENQDLRAFFRALGRCSAGPGGRPLVRILGKADAATRGQAAECGVDGKVEFAGFRPHGEVVAELRRARGLLLLGWSGRHADAFTVFPAKTYEYLASGRPILALAGEDSEIRRILGGVPGVTVAAFEDEERIHAWLASVLGPGPPPGPTRGVADPYTRAAQAAHLRDLLEEVRASGGRP